MNQNIELKSKHTRFRAYQLKSKGSSFSYWDGNTFTLGEARLNKDNVHSICHELDVTVGVRKIDVLHITGWDKDHCDYNELQTILTHLEPVYIDIPCYLPDTDNGKECYELIRDYAEENHKTCLCFSDNGLSHLSDATSWGYANICWRKKMFCDTNNNSSIQLFRSGCFTVLSLGDVESKEIADGLLTSEIICNEVDILILPHHGADNGFISNEFLRAVKPKVAIAMCDWDNQYKHPDPAITRMLRNNNIPYYSTKQGDIIIESIEPHKNQYKVWNYISGGERRKSVPKKMTSKRYDHWYKSRIELITQYNKR